MTDMDDLPDEVQKLAEVASKNMGVPPENVATILDRQFGLDISEIEPDDAKEAREAWEDDDVDTMCEVILRYDVDEEAVEQFRSMASDAVEGGPDTPEPSSNGGVEGRVDQLEQQVNQIQENQPTADEIVAKLEQRIGGGGGGGGGGAPADANQQNQLAPIISAIMQSQGGGGLGQQVQEKATERFISKAFTPSPGEIMGNAMAMKQYQQMAEEMGFEIDNGVMEKQMKNMFDFGVSDDDGDDTEAES